MEQDIQEHVTMVVESASALLEQEDYPGEHEELLGNVLGGVQEICEQVGYAREIREAFAAISTGLGQLWDTHGGTEY